MLAPSAWSKMLSLRIDSGVPSSNFHLLHLSQLNAFILTMEHVSRHNILSQHAHILQYLAWNCVVCKIYLFPKREASELQVCLAWCPSLLKFPGDLLKKFSLDSFLWLPKYLDWPSQPNFSEAQTSTRTVAKREWYRARPLVVLTSICL